MWGLRSCWFETGATLSTDGGTFVIAGASRRSHDAPTICASPHDRRIRTASSNPPRRSGSWAARDPDDPEGLKVLAHVAILASLHLLFSFALFPGLQVAPIYGNIGIAVTVALAALYVYIGFIGK